jgi:hypothetical protein
MSAAKHIMAAALLCVIGGAAQAQYVSSVGQPQPLYPYVVQPQYVYPQPQYAQPYPYPYPYMQSPNVRHVPPAYQPPRASVPRKVTKTDPTLVEELRHRHKKKEKAVVIDDDKKDVEIDRKIVVREKPIVRKKIRVVDDPPIVVRREIDEHGQVVSEGRAQYPGTGGRVIHAEAEVTILGPDRMNIRLYRKPDGRDANAKELPAKRSKTGKRKSEPQT